ncbi:MAG TPA: alpha/beta fold hydrolase [Candidatus Baltobacteraceae bacterium]|jgi:pimeloyl-ACP methyl ester carboxylesterase|nr:alpha/beta fold hydrolase [Candidatus Baltobacteraceae bacterium]
MIAATALIAVSLAQGTVASANPGLHVRPCVQGKTRVAALCGTFGVFENRAARSGRIIPLKIIVLRAAHPSGRAIAVIAGGPGESAVQFAPAIADGLFFKPLRALRSTYDILFVDQRGMGGSNPSGCDFAPAARPALYFAKLFPDILVRECRRQYTKRAEIAQYTTRNAVDDLNDVRSALGYRRIVLDGGSYGTFTSLIYIRRHPRSVESAVLTSVAAPHFMPLPGSPQGAQRALDDLMTKCRNNAACHRDFPQFAQHFALLMARLDRGPIAVQLRNPATKRMQTVRLSKEVFVDRLREGLYDPFSASYVPFVVERAFRGDSVPLARYIDAVTLAFSGELDMAAGLSYSCADWIPFLSPQQVANASARSFTGDLRVRAQQRACSLWNVPAMPPSFQDPVRSTVPVLIISASDDPATPADLAQQALHYLPNGRQVLVRGAGHSTENTCTDALILQFVRARSAQGLDVSHCRSAFKLPPFATSMAGWPSP